MKIISQVQSVFCFFQARLKTSRITGAKIAKRDDLLFCYDVLKDVSRSFAMVICDLEDSDLRDGVCLFYLILRALDTIEDDMTLDLEKKIDLLREFSTHVGNTDWSLAGVGKGRERDVLEQLPRVSREFNLLKPAYQKVIVDITLQMSNGMTEFLKRPVVTVQDFDLYCHYVAGLVGEGISSLLANCGFEDPHIADDLFLSNEMGLFLQKTNIIRDYYEDIREEPPRMFWPQDIWKKYANELKDFACKENKPSAVLCLNHLVDNALKHVPAALDYIVALEDPSVLRFCAIPQVMAFATICEVYNNYDTFQVKVKISKLYTLSILHGCKSTRGVLLFFQEIANKFLIKLATGDPFTPSITSQLDIITKKVDNLLLLRFPPPAKKENRIKTSLIASFRGFLSWIVYPFQAVKGASVLALRSVFPASSKIK